MSSAYRVTAAIDVHKKWLYVVVAQPNAAEREVSRCRTGSTSQELTELANWLHERDVSTVVMESTAQYWKPVWAALEGSSLCCWRRPVPMPPRTEGSRITPMPRG